MQPFTRAVTYSDGVSLRVTGMKQAAVTGQGPGVITGEPTTTFNATLTNKGTRPINLNQVVVTAVYGSPGRLAKPVYDATSQDFAGTIKPGASSKAAYAFSIPTNELGHVKIAIDFDGAHAAAMFEGSAK
ncbi:MAG: hypothetical protein ACR2F6_02450 [Mycobacteriales bacterium]